VYFLQRYVFILETPNWFASDVLLQEGGDFGDENRLPPPNPRTQNLI